ncbi:MAG: S8 family serine peptidase [Fimbriimonadales bacterium]|nr:S8 family serine peptidase [Fimbriimonadales bacterium]
MRLLKGFLGCMSVVVALQLGWAQLEVIEEPVPSLDPKQITAPFVPGELVVGLEQGNLALPVRAMEMVGAITSQNPAINAYVVRLASGISMESAGEFLRVLPGVRYVEPNYLAFAFATPNDPSYGQQYGLARIQANLAWDIWQPQRTVHIAIIDTGIDSNHPDLTNKMRRHANGAIYGYNTLNNTTNALDDNGHGTHCAGIAAAEINNGVGVAGVAVWNPIVSNANSYAQLMPVKVLSSSGSGSLDAVARGITWAADNGAHILSLSLGAGSGAQQLQDAVNYAWNRGCLVVVAAGNGGSSSPQYPAYYTNSIAVAATDSTDTLASFSQYGSWVDIAAPGVNILSTYPSNRYQSLSGTSMACPHVAGAAAVLWSHNPNLTNAQLRSALETNVDPYQPLSGRTLAPNAGRLNVYRALQAVGGGGPTQPTLDTLSLNPTTVVGGNSVTGTVTLTSAAPSGGFVVNLSSSNAAVASVPSSVTVPAGATSANFTVSTAAVSSSTNVTITASAGGVSRTATLTVNPASTVTLQSLTISPTSVWGGSSATGTVTLSGPAPAGGATVQLRSNSSRASVPTSVTIPAGATSANFTIRTTSAFSITTVTITATYNGVSRSAQLTVWF